LICTTHCFPRDLGKRQLRFRGYKELSYLHPRYFKPERSALAASGLREDEPFVLMRLVAWRSEHDLFQHGFIDLHAAVRRLEQHARVVISAEVPLPEDLDRRRYRGPTEKIHDVLAFARLYMGESATMGAEAAMLGTPSIIVSTSRRSYIDDLQYRYGLVSFHGHPKRGQGDALDLADSLLTLNNTAGIRSRHRARMLAEQDDVSQFVTDVVLERRRPAR
jgi:hypothetical protein